MKQHRRVFTIEEEKEICELYCASIKNSSKVLARLFDCNWGSIINILRRNGINPRTNSESQRGLRTGKNHPSFKGGNISDDGYRRICVNNKILQEHRYLMERHLGRKLSSKEIIHHINEDKLDNRVENLQIMSRSEHAKHHNSLQLA